MKIISAYMVVISLFIVGCSDSSQQTKDFKMKDSEAVQGPTKDYSENKMFILETLMFILNILLMLIFLEQQNLPMMLTDMLREKQLNIL